MTSTAATVEQQLARATAADLHPAVLRAVEAGDITILDIFDNLPWFKGAADWTAWRAFLCALYALPMTDQEFAIYRECTGRREAPKAPAREAWCPTGRRARKSAIAALIGVWEGGFRDYSKFLAPGERASIPILGKNKAEAQQIHSYTKAILSDPSLRHLLAEDPGAEEIKLTTGVDLRIRAVSLTAGRSKTIPLALLDEVAFFATEGAVPDVEVVRGIRPGMATIPGAKLFGLSSPWGKRGLLYEKFKAYYPVTVDADGKAHYDAAKEAAANRAQVLVWKAPTLRMHDTPQLRAEVAKEYETDPISAAAEYGAEFREDTDAFVLESVLDAATVKDRLFLPPTAGRHYFAFVDPSGGSSDSLTLAIAHYEADPLIGPPVPDFGPVDEVLETRGAPAPASPGKVVLDYMQEWRAPFDPEDVTSQCAGQIKRYGLRKAIADKYGGKWPASGFARHGVALGPSSITKSEIYREFLPLLNTGQVELLDKPTIKAQFLVLDRNVSRQGRETIDHAPGAHDDVANSVAGAAVLAKNYGPRMKPKKAEAPAPTTTTEIMKQRVAGMLAREKRGSAAGHRNTYRRRR